MLHENEISNDFDVFEKHPNEEFSIYEVII